MLDSSVVLALLQQEPLGFSAGQLLPRALISAVNYAEVLSKLDNIDSSGGPRIRRLLAKVQVVPFTESQARVCGTLRKRTKTLGLSLGDRACLALGMELGLEVLTADRAWAEVEVGCRVRLVR